MGIFGFGRRQDAEGEIVEVQPPEDVTRVSEHAAVAHEQLLDDIRGFLLNHGLAVTPDHLFLAHQAFSGANLEFAEQIAVRQIARGEITAEWLAETARSLGIVRDRRAEVDKLMSRLEEVLENFLATSHRASSAASDFGASVLSHMRDAELLGDTDRLGDGDDDVDGATEGEASAANALVELTRAILGRTREIEADMIRAEEEARSLRDRLKRAQRDARIDHLTGLPNRRAFDALYANEWNDARATGEPLCVALCDVDHFKRINDTYGHGVGDRVIQAVAKHFKSITNNKCHVARHGGEEFVLLFRGLGLEQAAEKLDAARATFARKRLINRETEQPIGQVSFSGGITSVAQHDTPSLALKAADIALYAAKAAGRNCIKTG